MQLNFVLQLVLHAPRCCEAGLCLKCTIKSFNFVPLIVCKCAAVGALGTTTFHVFGIFCKVLYLNENFSVTFNFTKFSAYKICGNYKIMEVKGPTGCTQCK